MFKGAKFSQDLSVTKSHFECSIWILSVMHRASYNINNNKNSHFDVDAGLLSTAWTYMFCRKWKELALFFRLTLQYKALEGELIPHLQI